MGAYIYSALAGLTFGAAGAVAIWLAGARLGLIDYPNERSSHATETPRGGGVGIALGYVLAPVFLALPYPGVYAGAVMGLLGLVEDRFALSSRLRLLLQFLICGAAVVAMAGLPAGPMQILLLVAMVLFACGTANFYNFMDGVNGMASLTGVVAFASLAFYAYAFALDPAVAAACIFIAFSCAGFLPFNMPKARVFMGDAGSMFLGFAFAYMVLRLSATMAEFLCVAMFLSLFYADCLLTLAMRGLEGRSLMSSHRSHLYQYLCNELGMAHWKVSFIYAAVQLAVCALSVAAYWAGVAWQVALFSVVSFSALLVYRSIKGLRPAGAPGRSQAGARL